MADDLKAVYLLTGSDRPKIERALRRLRDRYPDDSVERLHAAETSGADAVAACNSLGLFGGERLVVVESVERWKADDVKTVAAYVADPAPGARLALVADGLRKDSALTKAVAKGGEVLLYDVDRKKVVEWVVQQFAGHGAKVDRELARAARRGRSRRTGRGPPSPRERDREALDVGGGRGARVGGDPRARRPVRRRSVLRAHRCVGPTRCRRRPARRRDDVRTRGLPPPRRRPAPRRRARPAPRAAPGVQPPAGGGTFVL